MIYFVAHVILCQILLRCFSDLESWNSNYILGIHCSCGVSGILQLKALGIDNILGFDWPASPSPEAMIRALEVLYSLGVLDDDAKLTSPTGFQVAEIPLV